MGSCPRIRHVPLRRSAGSPGQLLRAVLAASVLVPLCTAGCIGEGDKARAPTQAGSEGPELRFRPSGRSEDLLCRFLRTPGLDQRLPPWVANTPGSCDCGSPGDPKCYYVDIRDDRRRSLVLSAGTRLRIPLSIGSARWLRFSVAAWGSPAAALDVTLAVSVGENGLQEWRRRARVGETWVDGSIDVAALGQRERVVISVSVDAQAGKNALLALAAPRLVTPTGSSPGTGPTNVLVYLIDTLRPDHTSVYGYGRPTTPRLEEMAGKGIVFDNAYSAAAWTRPSTASLFTSLHSSHHGAHSARSLASEVVTIAERFREAGWSTWAFVTNGHVFDRSLNFEQGFDRFLAIRGVRRDNHARTEEVNELVLPHLEAFGDEPFFLYVHVVDPHSPYDPPQGYRGLFSDPSYAGPITPKDTVKRVLRGRRLAQPDIDHIRSLYDEDIRYQDAMLGVLLDYLRETGLSEETLMVVTSDHGEEFYEHKDWEHGTRLYEEQVRIPLLMRVPGVADLAGLRMAQRVQIIDVMPTLLGWYGIGGTEACQGVDLGPLLLAEPGSPSDSRSIYCEEIREEKDTELFSLTDGSWKIIYRRVGRRERYFLFDLEADPGEQHNRSRSDREQLTLLRERLADHALGLARASPLATVGKPQRLDDATKEQLEALGYVNTGDPDTQSPAPGWR